MWQSLSFGANYKAAYCLASARLGRMSSAPTSTIARRFMDLVLQAAAGRSASAYVLPNSAAKAHAEKRFPHKPIKVVDSGNTRAASSP